MCQYLDVYSVRKRGREGGREREKGGGDLYVSRPTYNTIRAHVTLAILAYKLCYRDLCLQPVYSRGTIGGC